MQACRGFLIRDFGWYRWQFNANSVPVPGPAAFVTALVASGLPAESFAFRGFLPPKRSARRRVLERVKESLQTQVFYEAPHRIREALEDVVATLRPRRAVVVARELTKIHEEFLRGTAAEVLAIVGGRAELKGEIVLMIGPATNDEVPAAAISIPDRIAQLMQQEKLDEKAALKRVAKERGISKSEAYRELQQRK
jgi:16S rRNA (cytidine1402-2'-O)-methyltransferase